VEHYLGLRGSDTWIEDDNENQIITKLLIGQILTERTPNIDNIPSSYIDCAKRLQAYDTLITFNYDILLERALEATSVPYRLFPDRFESVSQFSATVDAREETEVVVLKMHGSVDWFDKQHFIDRRENARTQGYEDWIPSDPVFNSSTNYTLSRLVQGPRFADDLLGEIYRLKMWNRSYQAPPWFMSSPVIINPSAMKLIYSEKFGQFWYGMNSFGAANVRLAIIGYSLPYNDDYARQANIWDYKKLSKHSNVMSHK
jgi:SIR2-like domain